MAAVSALARPIILGEMISGTALGKTGPGIDGVKKVTIERGSIVPSDPAASTPPASGGY
ncbi:hypothetical protein ACGFI9_04930 [Micromonospora sp. NPDC048930]|uniref:hypothetical protein n=1 Tax=Micromonospora sp. NPDC048930 TaxID=3364261 RepID=UPI0037170968